MESTELNLLIYLPWDPAYAYEYEHLIRARHPDLTISTVRTYPEALAGLPDADIFMSFGLQLRPGFFEGARRLKWMHSFGAGLDGITDQASLDPQVIVTSTRGIHGAPLSEIAILFMLSLVRQFPTYVRQQAEQSWRRFRTGCINGKTVGILGVGLIAEDLAPRLSALGMEVVGITRTERPLPGFHRFAPRDDLVTAVADLDFLVLLIPLEPDTRNIINADVINAMKPGSYLINIARGGVVDEAALIEGLQSGHLGGAGLDTTQQEPMPPENPLWQAPNVIITPHIGGFYDRYAADSIDVLAQNIGLFKAGRMAEMINLVRR